MSISTPVISLEGYEMFIDQESGQVIACDLETGEVLDTVRATIPQGSLTLTPQALRRNKEQAKRRQQRKKNSRFGFIDAETTFDDLSPATMIRLVYLSTYADYAGRLMRNNRRTMQRKDLADILRVSKSCISGFWKQVGNRYIFEREEGSLLMDTEHFFKGKLPQKGHAYQRVFIDAVRSLYENTGITKSQLVGHVFKMLPYINREHNILCWDPDETNIEAVEPLTVEEFCGMIDYNTNNQARLVREYSHVSLRAGDTVEQFAFFVSNGGDIGDAKIIINPRVLYIGTNPDGVRNLCKLCE